MKKFLILFIVGLLSLVSTPTKVYASHFAAGDLTYECIGGNDYKVTYVLYRDCSGIPAEQTVTVQFVCSSNPIFNFNVTLQRIAGTGQEVTPGCSAIPTHCNGGSGYGIEEYVYQGIVTLAPCAN